MTVKAGFSTLVLDVAELERSIPFYELLGFEVIDTDRSRGRGVWGFSTRPLSLSKRTTYVYLDIRSP
jgi:hypothetical protein